MNLSIPAIISAKAINRLAVGSIFFIQGLTFASWASRIPTIQQSLRLSEAALGGVLLSLPVGLLASLPLSGYMVSKFGSRKIVMVSAVLYALMLTLIGVSTNVMLLVSVLFLFGFTGNMLNISVNTQAVTVEKMYGKSIMASFHGLWSLAGFSGASLGTLMIGMKVSPAYHFSFVAMLVVFVIFISSRFIVRDEMQQDTSGPLFVKPDKSLLILGVIAFCTLICEGAMFDWSGVYFKKVVLAREEWIGAGYAAFMSTMALGRFIADRFTTRFGLKRTIKASGLLIFSGLVLSVVYPYLSTAIIGFMLVGFGVSSVVPLVYGAAGKSEIMPAGMAITAVSTIGFFGFLFGPPLIGLVAGISSLQISFSIIALMGLSVFFFSFIMRK